MIDAAVTAALFVIEKVSDSLAIEVNLEQNLLDDIQDVQQWLNNLHAHFKDIDGIRGSALQTERSKQLRVIAYDIEDVLDEFLLHVPVLHPLDQHTHSVSKMAYRVARRVKHPVHSLEHHRALRHLSSEIKRIRRKKESLQNFDPRLLHLAEGSNSSSKEEDHHTINHIPQEDEIIGFEEQKAELIQLLLKREARRMTISVVGSAGSGKSVLVKSVFEDKSVVKQYHCHAWIHVSRSFNIDELLRRMLREFCKGQEELCPHGKDVLEELKNYLQQRRYLIVLDDLWTKDNWERIVSALPSGFDGSRIIVTTRNYDVASSCVRYPDLLHVHKLKALSGTNSWDLFCKKAFNARDGVCPKELMELSENILVKCEGLPFAIVAVSSLLSTRKKTPTEFKKLYDSLGSEMEAGSRLSIIGKILRPSYTDLLGKGNLKSCLLYFSIFPEDHSVRRGRLIRLWIAEGFIQPKRGEHKTVEMVAEEYLNELVERNLVDVGLRDFDGRVRSCRLLNLVREFLIQKSEEENFVTILAEPSTGSSEQVRRLSIQSNLSQNKGLAFSSVRSFFMFDWSHSSSSEIKKLLHQFRLLKVLDLEGAPLETFPEEIVKLTLLSYLSLRETNIRIIPKSIKKLVNLKTLNLKQTHVTYLPSGILKLQFLRHLLVHCYNVKNYVTFDSVQGVKVPLGIGTLRELQKLSLLRVNKEVIGELGALVHLKKLGILDLKREDGSKLCEAIMQMEGLVSLDISSTGPEEYLHLDGMNNPPRYLQRLYLKGRLAKLPGWISSPSLDSLVRIYLKWSKLNTDDNPLRALETLPNLLELEMVDSYMGAALEFKAHYFKKLKVLHLEKFECLNLVVVEENAMSKLEKLTICQCKKLEMLPLGIDKLTQLEELLLYDMEESFLGRLIKDCEDRRTVDHIKIIHSFTLVNQSWSFRNLS